MNRSPIWLVAGIASLLLGACATVGPDFSRPEVPWLDSWQGGPTKPPADEAFTAHRAQTEEWWRNFNDPVLDQLVAEAQRLNHGVRTAGLRIMEARAQLGIAGSTLYPQLQQLSGQVVRAGQQRS